MPINCPIKCLINSEQFVNNSWTIRVQFVFQETIRIPNKINSCPQKMKAALMNPFMSILGEERGKSAPKKTNNFERFFADSTLTFLTLGNTFRLLILPTRCLVLLRGRERKIWGRQIKIRGRQIFPGCAPKIPVFKGKVTKKGGAEAPPISLYKYNTFHRQKQEVLKPKNRLGCGKGFLHEIMETTPPNF